MKTVKSLNKNLWFLHKNNKVLPKALKFYKNSDFVIQLKVRFIYFFCLSSIGILMIVLFYSAYIQTISDPGGKLNIQILFTEASGLIVFTTCLLLLSKGFYSISAHLLLISGLIITWIIMIVDNSSDPIKRLDSVIFSLAVLSMTPLIIPKCKLAIPIYFSINIAALLVFIKVFGPGLGISMSSRIDYFADTTLGLLFTGIVSYNIFSINKSSLEKVLTENIERKKAEEALIQSENRFRLLFSKAPTPMAFVSKDGTIIDINHRITQVFGYTKEDIPNLDAWWSKGYPDKEYREFVQSDWSQKVRKAEKSGNEIEPGEYQVTCKNGSIKYMIIRADTLEDNLILSLTDITERKKAEEERVKLQEQLLQVQKMDSVGKLAGGVAHDFNNMLGAILGYADMAQEKIEQDNPIYEDLQEIINAAERSANLTRQLLAFARKQTISPKILEVNTTIESMLNMLQRLLGEDITLKWSPGKDVWPIMIDPSQFDQILANLCVNARDAISGNGKITIETTNIVFDKTFCSKHAGYVTGQYVQIAVSDNGCGMNKETLDQIFEPFFTTKELGKGTGLGLATLYGIVKQNDGFVNVYSEIGIGTTFKIFLPGKSGKIKTISTKPPVIKNIRGTETILIVEDEAILLKQTSTMLKGLGYQIIPAKNPLEAIRLAKEYNNKIQLILTDVVMPDMNGKDLVKKLTESYPTIKSLFMSGYTADVIAHHGVLDEGIQFIQKPFTRNDLAYKIRAVLEQQ